MMARSNNSNDDFLLVCLLIGAAIVCGLIFKFSQLLGIDFSTAFLQIGCLVALLSSLFALVHFGNMNVSKVWPLWIFGLYISIAPTVNYWAAHESVTGYLYNDGNFQYWWYAWYSKLVILIAAGFITYLINKY